MARFAIIGCGTIGKRHAEVITAAEGACVVAAYDTNGIAAAELAAKFKARAAASVDEVVRTDDVDAVVLCAPSSFHAEAGIAAIEHGKMAFWKTNDGAEAPAARFDPPPPPDLPARLVLFQRQYQDFLRARLEKQPPVVRPEEALSVVRTVLAFYESSRGRNAVAVGAI